MHESKHYGWLVAGALVLIGLGLLLPRHLLTVAPMPSAAIQSTVPPSLLNASDTPPSPSQSAPQKVVVYVCGAVHHPGVYTLDAGRRVADGIAQAGGTLADADLEQLNLAEQLTDAMKIDVPKKGQILAASAGVMATLDAPRLARGSRHHSGRSSHKLQPGQTLNINTASASELTSLPGVGPGLARRIIEYRMSNGPFQNVDDLQNVSGIGASKFERIVPFIRL